MIPFPKMHIAASVINRVLNTVEGKHALGVEFMPPPVTADPLMQGAALDSALSQQMQPVGVAPELEQDAAAGALEESAAGGSPLAGMIGSIGLGL